MAARKPIVVVAGKDQQVQAGDVIDAVTILSTDATQLAVRGSDGGLLLAAPAAVTWKAGDTGVTTWAAGDQ